MESKEAYSNRIIQFRETVNGLEIIYVTNSNTNYRKFHAHPQSSTPLHLRFNKFGVKHASFLWKRETFAFYIIVRLPKLLRCHCRLVVF